MKSKRSTKGTRIRLRLMLLLKHRPSLVLSRTSMSRICSLLSQWMFSTIKLRWWWSARCSKLHLTQISREQWPLLSVLVSSIRLVSASINRNNNQSWMLASNKQSLLTYRSRSFLNWSLKEVKTPTLMMKMIQWSSNGGKRWGLWRLRRRACSFKTTFQSNQ